MSDSVTIISPQAGGLIKPKVRLQVVTREKWEDGWEKQPYLEPRKLVEAAGPNLSSATFVFRYGEAIKREDSSSFAAVSPLALRGHFIQVQVMPQASGQGGQASNDEEPVALWTGVVMGEGFDTHGATSSGSPQGDEFLTAYGMEVMLDRKRVVGAWVKLEEGVANAESTAEVLDGANAAYIDWSPVFNDRFKRGAFEGGNMAARSTPAMFGSDDEVWTNKAILEYLLHFYGPEEVTFELGGQTDALEDIKERHTLEGMSVREALNVLIPRARGLGWCTRVSKDDDKVGIHVFTTVGETVGHGSYRLRGNQEKASFAFDDAADIERALVSVDEYLKVDRIIVHGERVQSCFHLSIADGTLEKGWIGAVEEEYRQSVGSEDPFENDAERRTDKYHRVFRFFRVPYDWDWEVGDGKGGEGKKNANPYVDVDGSQDEGNAGAYWNHALTFLRRLPIERNTGGVDRTQPEYMPPVAIVQVPWIDDDQNPKTAYCAVENLSAYDGSDAYLRMVDREGAVEVRTHTNHTLALGHWKQSVTGDASEPAETAVPPEVDYTTLIVCVAVETDTRVRVELPIGKKLDPDKGQRIAFVRVREAHMWYVVPGTIYAVDDGELFRHDGGWLRDDSERVRAAAAFAKAWYGQDRSTVRLELQKVYAGLRVGTYVRDASSSTQRLEVGTVVTRRTWDLATMRTTIETAYVELDFEEMTK